MPHGRDCIRDDDCMEQNEFIKLKIRIIKRVIGNRSKCIWNSAGGSIFGEETESTGIGKSSHTWRGGKKSE